MPIINYYDGEKYLKIEVSDKVAQCYAEITDEEKRKYWREKKRKPAISLNEMLEFGTEIKDSIDLQEYYIDQEEIEQLNKAMDKLPPYYREIVQKYYFEGKTQTEIAKEKRVGQAAISRLLERIIIKIRKNF